MACYKERACEGEHDMFMYTNMFMSYFAASSSVKMHDRSIMHVQGFQSADYPCDKSSYIRFVYDQ